MTNAPSPATFPPCGRWFLSPVPKQLLMKPEPPCFREALSRYGTAEARRGLAGPDKSVFTWAMDKPMKQDNRGSPQLDRIECLMPHARQFVTFRQAVANAASLGASLTSLLDKTRVSFIQLDRNGRILAANDRARLILDQRNGLSDLNGFLHAMCSHSDNGRLRESTGLSKG